ncbi:hypothetical protein DKT68_15165 [Micromonospora acroterricola]|uniref:Uncharacterized protein n=1 Tax=Micromonospora acroterricola TaxID=2202421 RepID=A0A317D227_9ACTN|nr:hypothetical protein [Micromonospora acroterricola]PWR08554.1 hypothetical protein DKT68_15165 [Micromonospora acroterricola]
MSQTDIVLVTRDRAPTRHQPGDHIHSRWPGDETLVANGAVAAMVLVGGGTLIGGFTGRLEVESPVTAALILLLYALAWVALRARRNADRHAAPAGELS